MYLRASSLPGSGPTITIFLDPEHVEVQTERLVSSIGTASMNQPDPPTIRCAFSVANFRKIKELFPGTKIDRSHQTTVDMIENLRQRHREYERESREGAMVKDFTWDANVAVPEQAGYDFKLPPFRHQVIGFMFLHAMKTPALFGDCGVGKTFIVGTWADSLVKDGCPLTLLVICPVNIIKHAWQADLEKFTDLKAVRLHEPSSYKTKEKRAARFATDGHVYIINPELAIRQEKELMALIRRHLKAGREFGLVIDESSKIKSHTSQIYRLCKKLRHKATRAVIMTGTPASNGIGDLWSQFDVLDLGMTLQPRFVDYRHDTHVSFHMKGVDAMVAGQKVPVTHWRPKAGIGPTVYRMIQDRMVRFRAEDCVDLPDKQFLRRDVEMTKEQRKFYNEMKDILFSELEGEQVTARVAVVRLMKLREITGGFVITDQGNAKRIGRDSPKMIELDGMLDQILGQRLGDENRRPTKAIVWAQYQWECKELVKRYRRFGARGLFGGISQMARERNIDSFKGDDKCQLLVCHPKSAGHGLTLTEANYAFYYSLSYDYEEFYQSARRIARPGQTRPMFFYFLMVPNSIDFVMLTALQQKRSLSQIITDGCITRGELEELSDYHSISLNIDLEADT